jgi:hypothetical protein
MSVHFRKSTWIVALLLVALLAGCIGGDGPEETTQPPTEAPTETPAATEDMDAAYTQAAQTIEAELTMNAPPTSTPAPEISKPTLTPTETLPPTSTPLPTNTPLPSATLPPTNTLQPTRTPTLAASTVVSPAAETTFKLIFEDDFSWNYGWVVGKTADYYFRYALGGYIMRNLVIEDMVWSVRKQPNDDVRVEAIGHRINGPRDGYFGVTCRHEDGSNYLALVVGSDGSYGIARQLGGTLEFLKLEQDTQARINTGNGINHVRGDCIGTKLTLYANGYKLMEVEDPTITAGSSGMVVGTRSKPYYEVLFDYFAVYEPVN